MAEQNADFKFHFGEAVRDRKNGVEGKIDAVERMAGDAVDRYRMKVEKWDASFWYNEDDLEKVS